jgi:hypothetical protein
VYNALVEFVVSRESRVFDNVSLFYRQDDRVPTHPKAERVVNAQPGLGDQQSNDETKQNQRQFDGK